MAIEDEIINIEDLDKGTEILNNDQLIIETNNGTKLIKFKDFIIGEENITFADKLVQGLDGTTNDTTTATSEVTGYNILTTETTPGHVTKYADISGTTELGKFNYNAIVNLAALSATISQNNAEIETLKTNLATITTLLNSTSALSGVAVTTKAVNFMVSNSTWKKAGSGGNAVFDTADLDPTTTNSDVDFTTNPFSITYPSEADDTFMASWILFSGDLTSEWSSGSSNRSVEIMVDNASKHTARFTRVGTTMQSSASFTKSIYIKPGQTVRLVCSHKFVLQKGSSFAGQKAG